MPAYGVAADSLTDQVRADLAGRLPEYMLPAALVPMTALPLNGNGKVDRTALPTPTWTDSRVERVAPRDPLEQLLAGIWQEVLHVEGIGVHDDFFRLGGHSLLGAQALSRIGAALETEVPIRILFEAPTIDAMARALRSTEETAGQTDAVAALRMEAADLSDAELRALLDGPE